MYFHGKSLRVFFSNEQNEINRVDIINIWIFPSFINVFMCIVYCLCMNEWKSQNFLLMFSFVVDCSNGMMVKMLWIAWNQIYRVLFSILLTICRNKSLKKRNFFFFSFLLPQWIRRKYISHFKVYNQQYSNTSKPWSEPKSDHEYISIT